VLESLSSLSLSSSLAAYVEVCISSRLNNNQTSKQATAHSTRSMTLQPDKQHKHLSSLLKAFLEFHFWICFESEFFSSGGKKLFLGIGNKKKLMCLLLKESTRALMLLKHKNNIRQFLGCLRKRDFKS